MRHYLVVANQTLGGAHLREAILERMDAGSCSFHIVVPATPVRDQLTWTEGQAHAVAEDRLSVELAWFHALGAEAEGEVGDARAMFAIADALRARAYDEVIISTLPAGASRWLRQDLPSRVRRRAGIPVTHLIGEPVPVAGAR